MKCDEDASCSDNKRVPIDTLARLFPQMKRNVLRSTLDRCEGDVLKAIEQLIYRNNKPESGRATPPPSAAHENKRKTSEPAGNHRDKMRYTPHQQLPDQAASFPWKMPGSPLFPAANSAATRPLFPLHQSNYFPTFGYSAPSFLTSSFLRPDYPVFPGMSLLSGTGGSAPPQSPLEPISPYVTAYGHSAGPSILRASPPNVKQEPDNLNGFTMSENHGSSPRSDPSAERSPYSD